MSEEPRRPALVLRELMNGYRLSQAIHVAADLGIADALAEGPRTSDELAIATGADPGSLYRLLRALAAGGLLHEDEGKPQERLHHPRKSLCEGDYRQ